MVYVVVIDGEVGNATIHSRVFSPHNIGTSNNYAELHLSDNSGKFLGSICGHFIRQTQCSHQLQLLTQRPHRVRTTSLFCYGERVNYSKFSHGGLLCCRLRAVFWSPTFVNSLVSARSAVAAAAYNTRRTTAAMTAAPSLYHSDKQGEREIKKMSHFLLLRC